MLSNACGTACLVLVTIVVTLLVVRFTAKTIIAPCTQPLFFDTCSSTWERDRDSSREPFPMTVVQTWRSLESVPSRVREAMLKYAPGYKYVFFDDDACLRFMRREYPRLVPLYTNLQKGAHKADLFRYCYLYVHGGIWIDIKTTPLMDLSAVFANRHEIYTAKSITDTSGHTCFQGVLAVPPNSAFMRDMIASFVMIAPHIRVDNGDTYLIFCRQMFRYVEEHYDTVRIGHNTSETLPALNMFEEYEKTSSECDSRRPYCYYIRNAEGEDLFRVRDDGFPWKDTDATFL